MTDLRDRVPGHSLIEKLLELWDQRVIRLADDGESLIIGDEAISWYDGVKGEQLVAAELTQLSSEFTVLHSVPIGAGGRDVDHLVIGPSGVFSINTKNSSGLDVWAAGFGVYVNGSPRKSYVKAAINEHDRVDSTLSRAAGFSVPVTTLIAFVSPRSLTLKHRPGDGRADIRVVTHSDVVREVDGPRVMSDEQVSRAVAAATQGRTWLTHPPLSLAGEKIAKEFQAFDEAVGWRIARYGQVTPVSASALPVAGRARATTPQSSSRRPARTHPTRPLTRRLSPARTSSSPRSSSRPSHSSRRRQSATNELVRGLLGLAGLFALWFYFTQVFGR